MRKIETCWSLASKKVLRNQKFSIFFSFEERNFAFILFFNLKICSSLQKNITKIEEAVLEISHFEPFGFQCLISILEITNGPKFLIFVRYAR